MEAPMLLLGVLGDFWTQSLRFLSLRDEAVRAALFGGVLLGIGCGVLGAHVVARRFALLGDTLSHAVLPGVGAGFLVTMTKQSAWVPIGAAVAGVLGVLTVRLLTKQMRLKQDTAMALVLSVFFAAGAALLTHIQQIPGGAKAGLDRFLFGQAAALSSTDIATLGVITLLACIYVAVFNRELVAGGFDSVFSRSSGLPVRLVDAGLFLLVTVLVVAGLQAAGAVMVSALLVVPAATGSLLCKRLPQLVMVSAALGAVACGLGAYSSMLAAALPTGPLMVLWSSVGFGLVFLLAPERGVIATWWRQFIRIRRMDRENLLKGWYQAVERGGFFEDSVPLEVLAQQRGQTLEETGPVIHSLERSGLATRTSTGDAILLTEKGWRRAVELVRNHRLWELYLHEAARLPADHLHESAEEAEHWIGDKLAQSLEKRLGHAQHDPHGRIIPRIGRGRSGQEPGT